MSELSKRSTIYFEPVIHHALTIKAATTHQSVSEVVNEAIRIVLRKPKGTTSIVINFFTFNPEMLTRFLLKKGKNKENSF